MVGGSPSLTTHGLKLPGPCGWNVLRLNLWEAVYVSGCCVVLKRLGTLHILFPVEDQSLDNSGDWKVMKGVTRADLSVKIFVLLALRKTAFVFYIKRCIMIMWSSYGRLYGTLSIKRCIYRPASSQQALHLRSFDHEDPIGVITPRSSTLEYQCIRTSLLPKAETSITRRH